VQIYRVSLEPRVSATARPARFLTERSTSRYAGHQPHQATCAGIRRRNGGDLNDLIDFFRGESI
jgi:hypothetical protein